MTRRVKAGVLSYAAHTLEASVVGGFSACFSSKDVCRVCHIQHKELETRITGPHANWSETEYDAIIQSLHIEDDEEESTSTLSCEEDELSGESDVDVSVCSDSVSEDDFSDGENIVVDKHGVKSNCPLNVLESFHRNELNWVHFP